MKAKWTKEMEAELARMYETRSAKECAQALGVGVSSIHNRVHLLGLRKSSEWISERTRQRWSEGRHENSRRAHFRKGDAPVNKGVPQAEWMPAASRRRCARTQFKPGELQGAARQNYVPIGAFRVTRDGQLQRKVTDDPTVYPARRWVAVARLVWEAANGQVPSGHVVRFRDGKARLREEEITLDTLECITRAENMRRNSYHNYPQPIPQLIQLRGALQRQINKRNKG